jgi:hypothetical protein
VSNPVKLLAFLLTLLLAAILLPQLFPHWTESYPVIVLPEGATITDERNGVRHINLGIVPVEKFLDQLRAQGWAPSCKPEPMRGCLFQYISDANFQQAYYFYRERPWARFSAYIYSIGFSGGVVVEVRECDCKFLVSTPVNPNSATNP